MFVCRAAVAALSAAARHARVHRSIISLWHASLRSALGTVLQRRLAHAPGEASASALALALAPAVAAAPALALVLALAPAWL